MGVEAVTLRRLADLAASTQHVNLILVGDAPVDDRPLDDLHVDSRTVTPGSVFVAVRGDQRDGHDLVADAVAAGAIAVVVEHPVPVEVSQLVVTDTRRLLGPLAAEVHGHPGRRMTMVGITGTNGKTTVSYLLAAMVAAAGRAPGVIGTIGASIDGEPLPIGFTTPEAPELQRLLRRMADAGVEVVAMEVSSHALALGRVDALRFAVAAFTNLSQDHLDFHGDLERYFAAKARLFEPARSAAAVVAVDDAWGRRLAAEITIPVTTVGFAGDADLGVDHLELTAAGGRMAVRAGGAGFEVPLPLAGRFNAVNTLVAIGCAAAIGISGDAIGRGLATMGPVSGRFERVECGQDFTVVVDFAHTPEAIGTMVAAARGLTAGRVIAVAGAGGNRDRAKRPLMGRALAAADLAVITSDNPRHEDPDAIIAEVTAELDATATSAVRVEPDRRRAIAAAVAAAGAGDVVLILGKGHETGQDTAGVVTPFDDRVVAAEELTRRLGTERA
ncbi:MAG: UDP-N-acetylmuramoyl-L-alanyl-D-glutamate--2,6-diaminopimelate ligase [Actinomycetota bacterium]|nr:UDP-N-acetylmuramoyl-L-alanyl-D-glutamate--2,6-diaminopimelate ligase [Actinomycetota bacterium]